MKTIQRIVKNTTILTSAEIINKALSLFLYIAIANYLKAAGYGRFSFIMAFLALFHVLANFGLNKLIIREVAKNKEITRGYVSFMMKLKTFFSLSAYLIFILCVCLMKKSPEVIYGAYLIGLSMIFISLSNVYLSVFNAHEKLEINAFSLILIKIIIVGLVILFISLKGSLLLILSAFVAGEAFRLLVLWLVYDKSFKCKLSEEAVKLPVKRILKTAFPFVLAGAASLIYMHVDKIMISVIKGDEAVGWYSAAYTLIVGLMFIPRCYTLSVFPAISRYAESSKRLLNISWQRSVKYLLIISLPIAVGVFILAERFINILYHSGYENATVALRILILAVPWIFVNSINIYLLYAANFQKRAMFIILTSALLNVVLNFILIPHFSYIGAAWSTVLAEVINSLMLFAFIYAGMNLKIKIQNTFIKPLLAVSFMGALIYYFKSGNLIMIIATASIVYAAALILLRTFDREDRDIVKKMITA